MVSAKTPNSNGKIRMLGGLLVVIGIALAGSMGWLVYWLQNVIDHPSESGRWTGGPLFTAATFRLFYSVMTFGGVSLATGLVHLLSGRRNKLLLLPILAACAWLGYSLWALLSIKNTL